MSKTCQALAILALLCGSAPLGCNRNRPKPPAAAHTEAPAASVAPGSPAPPSVPAASAEPPKTLEAAIAHGAELYGRMCALCHGAHGEGYKADQAPSLSQPDFLASVSDEALAFAIAEGRPGTRMSAWYVGNGGPLQRVDVLSLVAFVRSLGSSARAELDTRASTGDVARGHALFARECARCHGDKGPNVRIRERAFLAHNPVGFLRHALHTGRAPSAMPSFTRSLGEAGIEDVLAYLASLPAWMNPTVPPENQQPPPLPLGPVPLHPKGPEPVGFHVYPEMTSVAVVHAQYARGARMTLLDARVPSDYTQLHIAGAVSVPFYAPEPYLDALPKDVFTVCYCGCPHAESGVLAEKLRAAGFSKVTVLDEGLGEWVDKHYPVVRGSASP